MSPFPFSYVNNVQIPLCVWSRKFYDVIIIRLFYLKIKKKKRRSKKCKFFLEMYVKWELVNTWTSTTLPLLLIWPKTGPSWKTRFLSQNSKFIHSNDFSFKYTRLPLLLFKTQLLHPFFTSNQQASLLPAQTIKYTIYVHIRLRLIPW